MGRNSKCCGLSEICEALSAFVLMDTETGGVLAVQGGKEYVRLGLNRVNVKRQPGSTLKPLSVYAPVMEKGDITSNYT